MVDISTMDMWKTFFGSDITSTENAGGVWMDKSVFKDTEAFPDSVKMLNAEENFLVALSAIASNKEIVGYSTIPTDTMLVLDLSGSMDGSADELVVAANRAFQELLDLNKNNRVGIVLYSGNSNFGSSTYAQGATVLLPIDRYTTTQSSNVNVGTNRNPQYVQVPRYIDLSGDTVEINSTVKNSDDGTPADKNKKVEGSTYIQSGLFAALKEFEKMDTTVSGNFQDGQKRKPIVVLMSDGDPTVANSSFAAVDGSASDSGRGGATSMSMGFLTQLTASYVRNRLEAKYDCKGESLFYTLGLGVDGGEQNSITVAEAVLDTTQTTSELDGYWNTYLALGDSTSMELTVPSTTRADRNKTVAIYKNSNAVDRNYVTKYFEADSSAELFGAFESIVQEIIIQSRYYATDLEGNNPDFGGYMTFEDDIGRHMEVKDIKGILLGETLFSGAMLTSKIGTELGTIENPTALGDEMIGAVKSRLGITDTVAAQALVGEAWEAGQLSYSNEGGEEKFSNYIGWYSRADGSYAGFWNEGTTTAPADAAYTNKSYGFLGQAQGNIKDSDMMYMSVQVRTDISTGMQRVIWRIPAALMPMVTYRVTLQGNSIENASDVQLDIVDANPIRLLFEVGLHSEVNALSVAQITDPKHIDSDGSTRIFWTNDWDNSSNDPASYLTTTAHFEPSAQNERYYYTENATVYEKQGEDYIEITDPDYSFDPDKTYYHARWIFTTADHPSRLYEEITADSLDKKEFGDGRWYIPLGTIYRLTTPYQLHKVQNNTHSIEYRNYPNIVEVNDRLEVYSVLGNNGMIRVAPAQGIKLSKTVDVVSPDATDLFDFRITLVPPTGTALSSEYPAVIAELDKVVGEETAVQVVDNKIELQIKANQTIYITDLPAGTTYLVQELESNSAYKVKSVHINGVAMDGVLGAGTVAAYTLDDVDFVNTPLSEGNLIISKRVEHPYGTNYTVPAGLTFTAKVTLSNDSDTVKNQTFTLVTANGRSDITTDANGVFTVPIKSGETVAVEGIPERTDYTVEEINMPSGFTLDTAHSTSLNGSITAEGNSVAELVNSYAAQAVTPEVGITVEKLLNGRDWDGDSFEFVVSRMNMGAQQAFTEIARGSITAEGQKLAADLSNEIYTEVGTYHYIITETAGPDNNGITYDAVERRFHVVVTDTDMDGRLEISAVNNVVATVIGGNATDGWTVSAQFTNSYAPIYGSTVEIAVDKKMAETTFPLAGFKFALYDENGETLIHESSLTDGSGRATFKIAYAAADAGKTVKYVLREINTGISGMTYDTAEYNVTVKIVDNGDGTTSAYSSITPVGSQEVVSVPGFTNSYDPENGELIVSGKKNLTGRVQNAGEFTFTLYKLPNFDAPISQGEPIDTATNSANGDFMFDLLTFEAAGDYFFAVTEVEGNAGGIGYDSTVHRFSVHVADVGGKLNAVVVSRPLGNIVFNNSYSVEPITVELNATKNLSGRPIKDGEFSFELRDADGGLLQTKSNVGTAVNFDALPYTEAGTYTYTVSEVLGNAKGVAYDRSEFKVTVNVVDNGEGKLVPTVSYIKNNLPVTHMTFNNGYTPEAVAVVIDGFKALTGRPERLKADEFTFTLANAITSQVIATATNKADRTFAFEPIIIHAAGTYSFKVTENMTGMKGISYDLSVYYVDVVVTDNEQGNLVVSDKTVTKNGAVEEEIEFVNSYAAESTGVTLEGTKKLAGRDIVDGEFTFKLLDEDGEELQSVKNAGESIKFEAIPYSAVDVYKYTVVEDASAEADGMEYDPTVYDVTVTVTDDSLGSLHAAVEIKAAGEDSDIVFNNTFTPADIQVKLHIKKILDNKTNEAMGLDGFKFKIVSDGIDETVVTDENGEAEFTVALTAEQIGEILTFKITEVDTGIEYMVYSTAEHTATVKVNVDNMGVLSAELALNGQPTEKIVAEFTNVYNGKPEAPKTGDYRNMWMWMALMFVSGGTFVAATVIGRKEEKAK